MKGSSLIALAIPFFVLLMGVEWAVARLRGQRVYRLADVVGDMGCGILQQVGGLFLGVLVSGIYVAVYTDYRLVSLPASSWTTWVLAFLAVDVAYYWWHRLSHEVNFLWAVHVVHHQSEDYNLAVALRQAILGSSTSWPFYLPLALLGVPPLVMGSAVALNTLYQFWIHTELVRKLGWLESFLNTPSHHRVHHAVNPQYLDRNYAGVFIVWDRLFGSFEEERETPVYGVTRPLRSFNPLWAQVAEWVALAKQARAARRWRDKLRVWFAPPSWHPPEVEVEPSPLLAPGGYRKHDVAVSARRRAYVGVHFALTVAATFVLLMWGRMQPWGMKAGEVALLALSLVTASGLLEQRRWAVPVEGLRLALLGVLGLGLLWATPLRYAGVAGVAVLAAGAWVALRQGSGEVAGETASVKAIP
jgi:sterol desaturase/sphingolipid hydroxylase (fatty acid hydroxylase superfamily)